jgi:hypothetical protein
MVLYPAILLTIFAPGLYFPEMGTKPPSPADADVDADAAIGGDGEAEEYRMMTSEERMVANE